MKTGLLLLSLICGVLAVHSQSPNPKKKTLRHVVLVKFKSESTDKDIAAIVDGFKVLKKSISQLKDFEWGTNNSPENLDEGLTHAFTLTFSSEKDRDEYLVHPEHKKFVELASPHIERVVVVDYWVN
jgi:hypothetical protein